MNSTDTDKSVQRRTGGRSARVRDAVLHATREALAQQGFDGLTISEIARRSGVHATSIQRRWGSVENVLFEAVIDNSEEALPIPDTGSLRGDLLAFGASMVRYLATPLGETLLRALISAADDDALAANRAQIMRARYVATSAMVERAIGRGELRAGTDAHLVLDLLIAPLHLRKLTRQPIDDGFVEQIVDTLLGGLAK